MNKKSINLKPIFLIISFAFLICVYSTGIAQKPKKAVEVEQKVNAKIAYKNYIWIEGENSVDTNFSKEKTYNFFCSDRFALQLSKDADPASEKGYYATYVFYVPGTKTYDFWMGCTPPGSKQADKPGYASPFDWKIDNGDFKTASSENVFVKQYYAHGGYYWTKISAGTLTAGKHTLTIRIKQKRSSGWDYYFYIDAIVFIPTYSGYLLPLMNFPEEAPKNFFDKEKGITFEDVELYQKRVKQNLNNRESVFTLIQIYTWLYDYEKSIELCREYLKKNPKDIEIRMLLASTLSWADRLDDAIKEYNNIIAIDKKNITARKLLAVLAGWNNRYDEAIKNYREIIEVDRMNVDAYISLATQYSWKGEATKALEIFKRAESIAPGNIQVLYALGDNYYWVGKTYESIQQFKRIISIDEKEIEAYKKLAKIYISTGRNDSAKEIMENAARIVRIYPELSGFSLDITDEINKDRLATIEEYKKTLAKNPDDLETRKNLIDSYIWNKLDADAIKEYNILLNIKGVKGIEKTDKRIATLAIESIKLRLAAPILHSMKEKIKELNDRYEKAGSLLSKGKSISEEFPESKIKNDLMLAANLSKKVDLFEYNLSYFNDVISYYDKDVQNYLSQRTALKWELDRKRILKQAYSSEESAPQDYRPKKVIGIVEYMNGNLSTALDRLNFVNKADSTKAFPVYMLSLSESSRLKETEVMINELSKNKNFKEYYDNFKKTQDFIKALQSDTADVKAGDTKTMINEINRLAQTSLNRINELLTEKQEKLKTARTAIQYVYEKMLLDTEIDNVNIYSEVANYYLNKGNQLSVLDYYHRILAVQPLNVEINYKLGAQNQALGYWKSAMNNYELCINNDPDNQMARANHYDLQRSHSPSVKNEFVYFKDKQITRINNELIWDYPVNGWFSFNVAYGLRKIDDNYSSAEPIQSGGQTFATAKGSVTRHSGIAGMVFGIVPINTNLIISFSGHNYKGEVDFENNTLDSDISYSTINYSTRLDFPQFIKGLQLKFIYSFEDEAEQTQSLKLNFREQITSKTFNGILDLAFQDYSFPFNDRIFLYDSYKYRMMSDSNTRTSIYNQLSFRIVKIPAYGIDLDLNAINSYEASKFVEYDSGSVTNVPYWSPEKILTFGGGLSWKQKVDNVLNGKLSYEIYFQSTRDSVKYKDTNFTQTGYSGGVKFAQEWDKINYYFNYLYSHSKASTTSAEPYKSQTIEFGVQGKFYTVYSPAGVGGKSIVMATASPTMITPDGDGKDDFTVLSMTGFDEKGISSWEIEIFNNKQEKVKSFASQGTPPASLKWDGTDKANNPLPEDTYIYQLTITNSASEKNSSKRENIFVSRKAKAISPEVSYPAFSPNGDGTKDNISIELKTTDKDNVASWTLYIMDQDKTHKERKIVRTINGLEFLPFDVEWDGRDNKGNAIPDGNYFISINVKYKDGKDITSPDIKVRVVTKAMIKISSGAETMIPVKNTLRITPEAGDKDLDTWRVSFFAEGDKLIKMIQGSGKLPEVITWNGTDEKNNVICYNMSLTVVMDVVDRAGNKGISNKIPLLIGFLEEKQKDFTLVTLFDQGMLHKRKDENLSPAGKDIANRLIKELQKYRNSKKIRVVSHTSSDGSTDMNTELSKNRARILGQMIKDGLKLETGVVNINGMGKTSPYKKSDNRKWDDRYEIEIY